MAMDPNVQVAVVSVFATTITTLGVIAVAMINGRRVRTEARSDAGVEVGFDEKDVLARILSLIAENTEKDKVILVITAERDQLKNEVAQLRAEVELLKLGGSASDPDGGADV